MALDAKETVELLIRLKKQYGDLNRALIREYIRANGETSARQIAQDVGLSRNVVRRALQDWSN
jgi:predicted ArsR family transcriptional regulator